MKLSLEVSERKEDRWWMRYVEDMWRVGLAPDMAKNNAQHPLTLKRMIKKNPIRSHSNSIASLETAEQVEN